MDASGFRGGYAGPGAPVLAWELARLRFKDWSATQQLNHDLKEEIEDKDNHAWDCYSPDTDILTTRGWVGFPELRSDDQVGTWNDGALAFEAPKRFIIKEHRGEMALYQSRTADFCVTPTHAMFVRPMPSVRCKPKPFARVPVTALQKVMASPRSFWWEGQDLESPIPGIPAWAVVAWVGFWLAEGCKSTNHRGSKYAHVDQKDPDEDILELMKLLGASKHNGRNGVRFTLGVKYWNLVKDQGLSYQKRVPRWIMEGHSGYLQTLLRWMFKGDGSKCGGYLRYNTTSPGLADDVQEAILKCGDVATIGVQPMRTSTLPNGKIAHGRVIYHVYWNRGRKGQGGVGQPSHLAQIHREKIQVVPYDGLVYCVTTTSGVLMVRRNGKPLWCGNCLKMHMHEFPPGTKVAPATTKGGSVSWWRQQSQRARHGLRPRTFSVTPRPVES